MTPLVDSHCHLDSDRLDLPPDEAVARARAAGVADIVMAGVDPGCWDTQVALAGRHERVWPVYGVHPVLAAQMSEAEQDDALARLEQLAARHRPVAIGETGLDAFEADKGTLARQERSLRAHAELADRLGLPLVLHLLRTHDAALRVLKDLRLPAAGGLVHSFSGSAELVREYLKLGLHVAFCGTVSYPQSRRVKAAAAEVPPDRLLVETDSPDQTPHPHRGRPNRPELLPAVLAGLAEARDEPTDALALLTTANARRLFGLPA